MYFRKFPKIQYDVKGDGVSHTMTDITRRIRFTSESLKNFVTFDFYDVIDGDTPESVAQDYYGDVQLHWVVLLANNIRDVYTDWPMSIERFEQFVKSKYTDVNAIHHYEAVQTSGDTKLKIEYPNDSATTLPADAIAVTNYEYEESKLESKRRIKLIQPEYIQRIKQEFESIIGR